MQVGSVDDAAIVDRPAACRPYSRRAPRTSRPRSHPALAPDHFRDPARADAWVALVPLLVEQKELRAAGAAAERALEADGARPEAMLAVAYTSYRLGRIARAESSFIAALPRLPKLVRDRFDDIAP